jgi:hypothetical protein
MPNAPTAEFVAATLPGHWRLGATSLPEWLDGERQSVVFDFQVESEDPLVIVELQNFTTPEGKDRQITRVSQWQRGEFQSRGKGIRKALHGRWNVIGFSDDNSVAVLRVERSRGFQEGVLVLVRVGVDASELRSLVAASSDDLGLSPEEFGSLWWFDVPTQR